MEGNWAVSLWVPMAAVYALGCAEQGGASTASGGDGSGGTAGVGADTGGGAGGMPGGSGGTAASGGATGNPASSFCLRWIDEFSGFLDRCGCNAAAAERYRERMLLTCGPGGFFEPLVAAVAAGDLVFDADAADALFARLSDPDPLCVGESCSWATDCISPGHGDSQDRLCQDGVCVADICAEYSE